MIDDHSTAGEVIDWCIEQMDKIENEEMDNPWDILIQSLFTNVQLAKTITEIKPPTYEDVPEGKGLPYEAGFLTAIFLMKDNKEIALEKLSEWRKNEI